MARKSSNYEEAYLNTLTRIIVQIDAAKWKKNRFRMKTNYEKENLRDYFRFRAG